MTLQLCVSAECRVGVDRQAPTRASLLAAGGKKKNLNVGSKGGTAGLDDYVYSDDGGAWASHMQKTRVDYAMWILSPCEFTAISSCWCILERAVHPT